MGYEFNLGIGKRYNHSGPIARKQHDPASFNHQFATVQGYRYHYVDEGNKAHPAILLVHGFPDLWWGWRHQIPFLVSKGYRVIAVDTLGYGQTDAPVILEERKLTPYSLKSISGQLNALLDVLEIPQVILMGHDWGGLVVWRFSAWYPKRVRAVVSVCTPYTPPLDQYISVQDLGKMRAEFAYQIIFADPASTDLYNGLKREFLEAVQNDAGHTEKDMDYMVEQYNRNGFHGPLNYYRTRLVNFEEEKSLPRGKFQTPAYMILAEHDPVLKPEFSAGMPKLMKQVEFFKVPSGHFALTERPEEVNAHLGNILTKIEALPVETSKL